MEVTELDSSRGRYGGWAMYYLRRTRRRLRDVQHYNLETFRQQPLKEISGSMGDLGTLLPIIIALATDSDNTGRKAPISLASTLVFGGLANILTGCCFGIPLPVQPMKAIASVALVQHYNPEEITSAGLFVAGAIGFLSVTGLLQWFSRRIPIPVIKGIQLGVGFSLIMYGGTLVTKSLLQPTQVLVPLLAFVVLLWNPMYPRLPYALLVVLVGIVWALIIIVNYVHFVDLPLPFSIWKPHSVIPSPHVFRIGVTNAGLGQLPLTALNSVIAVSFLSADLLPQVEAPSTMSLGFSVMAINLVACWFGSMPVCHGSGGLAAQYRFGARSGASIIFLGLVKLLLGLFAGPLAKGLFNHFPSHLLGIMVIAAGLELVNVGESLNTVGALDLRESSLTGINGERFFYQESSKTMLDITDEEKRRRWIVMAITVAGILAFKKDAVGFLAGMLSHWSFELQENWRQRRSRTGGQIRLGEEGTR
jgi:hypothetical protein